MFLRKSFSLGCTKKRLAAALSLVAGLSFVFTLAAERSSFSTVTHPTGILTALAKEDASGGPAYDMFLKVDTIAGDANDAKHKNEIVVDSFSWEEARAINASRPTMEGFRVTMPASSASPKFFLYGAGGTKIPRVVLSVKIRGSQQDFLKWTLTNAQVLSYKTVGNAHGDGISDQIIFSFSKIEAEYRQPLPDGTLGPVMQGGWDQRTNKAS